MTTQPSQLAQTAQQITDLLSQFSDEEQARIVRSVAAVLGWDANSGVHTAKPSISGTPAGNGREPVFSDHEELSPKQFIAHKSPQTDVERVACLAYYLTHYRDLKYFKTTDISNLNTEAAQRKFANSTNSVKNASTRGYLAPAPQKKHKQISAVGEQYVDALPDRQLAKVAMEKARPRRVRKKRKVVTRKA